MGVVLRTSLSSCLSSRRGVGAILSFSATDCSMSFCGRRLGLKLDG